MPMIRFTTSYAYTDLEKAQISKIVQTCMESYFDTPPNDCFHFFEQLPQGNVLVDPDYWVKSSRTEKFILLYITSGKPRTAQQKLDLMRHVTTQLHQTFNIPEQDVMFVIVQNSAEDWCFGHAQRADLYLKTLTSIS
ncbi:tautomerase family protein [Acinetobacter sp. V110_1]|uniref:tautomerase family protein n=1 Tax=Acinetobacter sp. V110_1 TaxID=3072988 RepID=UPI00287C5594|nr:tautomerase family protein [Acinetobacter sp. V110_1]MDS7943063.1 tautomerase family protein [Acinetobacter sp. V110_1]